MIYLLRVGADRLFFLNYFIRRTYPSRLGSHASLVFEWISLVQGGGAKIVLSITDRTFSNLGKTESFVDSMSCVELIHDWKHARVA